jgi:hypothetical protein
MNFIIKNWINLVLYLLLLVLLIPILSTKYFPSEDGPFHVQSAVAYINYDNPDTPIFKEYFEKNANSKTNMLVYVIISSLCLIFSPELSERILIISYAILMFQSFKYLLSRISRSNGFIMFLFLPFILNYTIHLGFYNFSFSIVLFFFTFGYWIEHYKLLDWKNIIVLSISSILMFFFHPVSLVMYYIATGAMILWVLLFNIKIFQNLVLNPKVEIKIDYHFFFKYLVSLLPTIILFLLFIQSQGGGIQLNLYFWQIKARVFDLITLSSLYSFTVYELVLSTILSLSIFTLVLIKLFSRIKNIECNNKSDVLLFISIIYLIIYFISPDDLVGGTMLIIRLLLFLFFILLLWLGDFNYPKWIVKIVILLGIFITISYSVIYTFKYKEIDKQIAEYLSCVELIDSNSVILNLSGSQRARNPDGTFISDKVGPFWNIGSRVSYYKPVVDLSNPLGWLDYGLLNYRSSLNPEVLLHGKGKPYRIGSKKILEYPLKSKGRIDYVILWNYKYFDDTEKYNSRLGMFLRVITNNDEKSIIDTRTQLSLGYNLIFTSRTGLLELYRKIP